MTEVSNNAPLPDRLRPKIDVSHLPTVGFDARSPLWWGNMLLIFIETTTVILMMACYFYIKRNFDVFPPPKVDTYPPMYKTAPSLVASTLNLLLLAGSCALMYWTDMRARELNKPKVKLGLEIMMAVNIISIFLRWFEFKGTYFWWNDNAYASIFWATLGLHLTYLLGAFAEFFIMWLHLLTGHPLDQKHALDITLAGGYWYWLTGTWVLAYFVFYISPRVL
jgi:heme/copper-type cytochrome/quinol oxidase subunit 3